MIGSEQWPCSFLSSATVRRSAMHDRKRGNCIVSKCTDVRRQYRPCVTDYESNQYKASFLLSSDSARLRFICALFCLIEFVIMIYEKVIQFTGNHGHD